MNWNNQDDVKELKKGFNIVVSRTCAMIRARKLKLTEKQKEVIAKVINDKVGSCLDCRSELALLKKGYIVKKEEQFNQNEKSLYLINF